MLVSPVRPLPWVVSVFSLLTLGCADPCVDDGLSQKSCPTAQDQSGTADTVAEGQEAESGSGSAGEAEAGETMNGSGDGDGDASGDGDGDASGDGDGDGDGDLPPTCFNGVQDGDETDVDCGGMCQNTCLDGGLCMIDGDCIADLCNMGVCKDPVCDPTNSNGCQGCLQQQCCDSMIDCFQDPSCVCWFECISHNNDFEPCKTACNIGNIGPITSCANSVCNTADACAI